MKRFLWIISLCFAANAVLAGINNPSGGGGTNIINVTNISYATNSAYSSYSTNSGLAAKAVLSTNSLYSGYSTNCGIAAFSTNSLASSIATGALTSAYATNSGNANYATNWLGSGSVISTSDVRIILALTNPAAFDAAGSATSVSELRASASTFGLARVGSGLNVDTGLISAPMGYYSCSTNYSATLLLDGSKYSTVDVTNFLSGAITITMSNMVSGVQYVTTVKTDSSSRGITVNFIPSGKVWTATGSYQTTTIPANSMMVIQAQLMQDGSYVFSTLGAQ